VGRGGVELGRAWSRFPCFVLPPPTTPFPSLLSSSAPMNSTTRHGPGICAMRGGCGKKSIFTPELPCPDDGDAGEVSPSVSSFSCSLHGLSSLLRPSSTTTTWKACICRLIWSKEVLESRPSLGRNRIERELTISLPPSPLLLFSLASRPPPNSPPSSPASVDPPSTSQIPCVAPRIKWKLSETTSSKLNRSFLPSFSSCSSHP